MYRASKIRNQEKPRETKAAKDFAADAQIDE
jgi:hypothetical protein